MENSELSDEILALGRNLVKQLGLEDSTDTLGRWMAHHVASLITRAEKAPDDIKCAAERECFAAILELWKHRSELPDGKRPYEDLEPIIRAIRSLDPEDDTPRYYPFARPPRDEVMDESEQGRWLGLVEGLDYSAKVLIGHCLAEAADATLDKSKEWVRLASAIDDDGVQEVVIRLVSKIAEMNREINPDDELRSLLSNRIKRLRGFLNIGESFASTMEERLRSLPPSTEPLTT